MSLLRKGILAGGGSVTCAVFAVVTNMMLARALLPEGMGKYQLPMSAGILLATVLSLGIGQASIFYLNKHKIEQKRIVMNSVWLSFAGLVVLTLAVPVLFTLFEGYFGTFPLWIKVVFSVGIFAWFALALLRPVLVARLQIHRAVRVQVASRIIFLIIVVLCFVLKILSVNLALAGLAVSDIVGLMMVLYYVREQIDFSLWFDLQLFKRVLRYGLKIFLANIVYVVNALIGLMLLRYLMPQDFSTIGYYGRAAHLAGFIMLIPTAVGPLLYAKWAGLSDEERNSQVALAMRLHFAMGAAIVAVIIIFAPWIILILYGIAFLPAVGAMRILAFGVAFKCVSIVFISLLVSDGRAHVTAYIYTSSLIIVILLTCVLVPYMGMLGAAMADAAASLMVLAIGLLLLRRDYKFELGEIVLLKRSDIRYSVRAIIKRS